MSTQAAPAPVATATVNGVTATANMTGAEIFNAHLKAQGAAPVNPADRARVGMFPPLHVHSTDGGLADAQSVATASPPPAPAVLAKQNAMPTPAPVAAAPTGGIDTDYLTKLNTRYTTLMKDLEGAAGKTTHGARVVEKVRADYQKELQEIYDGRRMGEKRADFQARKGAGTAPASAAGAARFDPQTGTLSYVDVDGKITNSPAGMSAALDMAAKASSKTGWAPASAITGPLLHGYTIPPDREYQVAELVSGLRLARIGNLSQSQVSAIIANGWVKA